MLIHSAAGNAHWQRNLLRCWKLCLDVLDDFLPKKSNSSHVDIRRFGGLRELRVLLTPPAVEVKHHGKQHAICGSSMTALLRSTPLLAIYIAPSTDSFLYNM